ncbi:hypothetical protein [Paracoccus siganidrum]|uniref:hypothetical protein n=1 Tax=Paracoccus siganidrum TaxID=1276757 RepID=UPI0011C3B807|nr:hypothetical protein [Paracoccus siganidrum]
MRVDFATEFRLGQQAASACFFGNHRIVANVTIGVSNDPVWPGAIYRPNIRASTRRRRVPGIRFTIVFRQILAAFTFAPFSSRIWHFLVFGAGL